MVPQAFEAARASGQSSIITRSFGSMFTKSVLFFPYFLHHLPGPFCRCDRCLVKVQKGCHRGRCTPHGTTSSRFNELASMTPSSRCRGFQWSRLQYTNSCHSIYSANNTLASRSLSIFTAAWTSKPVSSSESTFPTHNGVRENFE